MRKYVDSIVNFLPFSPYIKKICVSRKSKSRANGQHINIILGLSAQSIIQMERRKKINIFVSPIWKHCSSVADLATVKPSILVYSRELEQL